MDRRIRHHRAAITSSLAGFVLVAVLGAGCTSMANDTSTPSGSPSVLPTMTGTAPAYCAAADKLKTSLTELRSVDVVSGGLPAIQAALTKVQNDLTELQKAAKSDFGPEVTQMRTALTTLQTALRNAASDLNTTTITTVAAAVGGVISAYTALEQSVTRSCP
jgi:uncharacterized protein YukE